jgi:hypothetical protein
METAALEAALAPGRRYPPSSLIERRPLTPRTEAELYASCRALVSKHSGATDRAYDVQGDAQANLDALHRTAGVYTSQRPPHVSQAQKPARSVPSQRMASSDPRKSIVPRDSQHNYLVQPTLHPGRDSSSKRREPDPAKRTPNRLRRKDSAHLQRLQNNPKARSSVQLGSSRWTNIDAARGSEQNLNRKTHDRSRSENIHLARSRSVPYSLTSSARVSVTNLAKNVKSEIQGYIRPGSSHLSRKGSRASMRSTATADDSHPEPNDHVWRSWGFQRRSSRASLRNSRPSSRSRKDSGDGTMAADRSRVNLNRDLPPLPGLDTWKKESAKGMTHIANLMRTDLVDDEAAGRASALDFSCVGSPIEATAVPTSDYARDIYQPRRQQSSKPPSKPVVKNPPTVQSSPRSSSEKASSKHASKRNSKRDSQRDSKEELQQQHIPKRSSSRYSNCSSSQTRQDSVGLASSRSSMRTSVESHAAWPLNRPSSPRRSHDGQPNYSRKGMRTPGSSFGRSGSGRPPQPIGSLKPQLIMYPNVVEIKALRPTPKKERGLKRVLSVLTFKNREQNDWMAKVEKLGAKEGVMVQDEKATGTAVVRY